MFEARLPARKFRKYVCTGNFNGVADADEKKERRDSEKDEVERHEIVGVEKTG
jgi:hypothetical protein